MEAKTVLITGSSRGIGLALCKELKSRGWKVVATCRNPSHMVDKKATHYDECLALDVESDDSIKECKDRLNGIPIDLLINNAGVLERDMDQLGHLTRQSLERTFNINAISPLLLSQALLPNLLSSKAAHPKIVNVSSLMGSIGDCGSARNYGYRASKAALNMITRTLSLETMLKERGAFVVAIHPGFVSTDMTDNRPGGITPEEAAARMVDTIEGLDGERNGCLLSRLGKVDPW